jgi:malonyl CoA-acyl carrier protein transacylase
MVIRGRADTAIAVVGLGRQFRGEPGLQADDLALEAAGRALADAGFPHGRGLNRDRAGVIIGTTLARRGSGVVSQRTPAAEEDLGGGWPTDIRARAGRAASSVLTAETMPVAADQGGGAGTIAGQACVRFGLHGAGHTVDGFRFSALLAVAAACSALAAGDLDFVLAGGVDTGPGPAGAGLPDGPGEVQAGDATAARDVPGHGCGVVALMRAGDAVAAGAPLYAEIIGWGMSADTGEAGARSGRVRTLPSLLRACRQAGIDPGAERLIVDVGRPRAAGAIAGVLKAALEVASGSELAEVSAEGLGGGTVNLLLSAPAAGTAAPGAGRAADIPAPAGPAESSAPAAGEAPGLPVYAFSGDDPGALIAALNRIAEAAPRLSAGERRDLASQLGLQLPNGPIRAAFAAGTPGELADRARSAARLLADLPAGVLRSAAGAYAGCGVRGRVVLLFPGDLGAALPALAEPPAAGHREPDAAPGRSPGSAAAVYRGSRGALSWLDRLGVTAAAAIGHGTGELTGLAWAGCISGEDAARLAAERDRIIRGHPCVDTAMLEIAADTATGRRLCEGTDLVIAAYNGPRAHLLAGPAAHARMVADRAAAENVAATVIPATHAFHSPAMAACASAFRQVLGGIRFAPPRGRLVSTITGRELGPRDNIPAMLASQFTAPVRFLEAVRAVARDTDLLCVAGPGHALAALTGDCCGLPAVTVPEDGHPGSATAAAALFAAGAVVTLDPLLEDGPARPAQFPDDEAADSGPSGTPGENDKNQRHRYEQCSDDIGDGGGNYGERQGEAGSGDPSLNGQGASVIPETAPVPRRLWTMTVQQPIGSERRGNASMPDGPGTAWPPAALRGRFLESVLGHYPGSELVAEAQLSAATDPYLIDHRVDGATELPAVMGLEAMAQTASALAGRPLSRAATITLGAPVMIRQDRPTAIRVWARNQGYVVEAVLRSAETGYRHDHVRALFPLAPSPREETGQPYAADRSGDGAEHLLDGMTAGIVDGTELYDRLRFPTGRFRRVAFLPELTSRNCRALLRGTDDKPWFGPGLGPLANAPLLLGSPGVNDAAIHVLQACVPYRKLVPVGCESLSCSGTAVRGAVEVRATERSAAAGEYVWDVHAVDTDGRPVASWTGLRLRDTGPLPRDEPWSPMLLAVYLERGAAALGLDPDLRVTVRAGHPRQASGIPVRSGGGSPPGGTGPAAGKGAAATSGTAPYGDERREAVAGIYAIAVGAAASSGNMAGSSPQLGSVLYPAAGAGGRARRSHLEGLTLMVDGGFPAACEWEAADGSRNAEGSDDWAEDLGAGFGALRAELLERCGEPAALVDARIWTAAQCLSKAGRGGQPLAAEMGTWPEPGNGRDGRWVLLRTGDAAIASTVVEIAGVSAPVAVAIMARAADAGPAGG